MERFLAFTIAHPFVTMETKIHADDVIKASVTYIKLAQAMLNYRTW